MHSFDIELSGFEIVDCTGKRIHGDCRGNEEIRDALEHRRLEEEFVEELVDSL